MIFNKRNWIISTISLLNYFRGEFLSFLQIQFSAHKIYVPSGYANHLPACEHGLEQIR